jgi:hypothetical protein
MNIDRWIGIVGLIFGALGIVVDVASPLFTPRLISYLEKRKLIKTHKTRQQALQIYNRIRAFREGRRDKYPFYVLLGSSAVLFAIAASTIIIVVLIVSPDFPSPVLLGFPYTVLALLIAFVCSMMSIALLAGIYETARQLERFDDYKKEFEERWGPFDEKDLRD